MNLYELSHSVQHLQDLLQSVDVTSNPEYAQALKDTLESVLLPFDEKIEAYAMVGNQLKADIKVVKAEIKRLQEKEKAYQNNLDRLNTVATQEMIATDRTKVKTPRFTIWVQNNQEKLDIQSEDHIPKNFYVEQAPKLSDVELKKAIKNGLVVEGVSLIRTQSLRVK